MKYLAPVSTNSGFLPLLNKNPNGIAGTDFLQYANQEALSALIAGMTGGYTSHVIILAGTLTIGGGNYSIGSKGLYIAVPNPVLGNPFYEIFFINPISSTTMGGHSYLNVAYDATQDNPSGVDPTLLTDGITNVNAHLWRQLKFTPASGASVTAVTGSPLPSQPADMITTVEDATTWVTLASVIITNTTINGDISTINGQISTLQTNTSPITRIRATSILAAAGNWTEKYGLSYWKNSQGIVFIQGDITPASGTINSSSLIMTLPSGYRPTFGVAYGCLIDSATGTQTNIRIETSGNVTALDAAGNVFTTGDECDVVIPPFTTN